MKPFHIAVASFLLAGPAAAQGINLLTEKPPMTDEERAKQQAIDDAYKAKMNQIPDQKASADPWGTVRSAPTTTTTNSKTRKSKQN